MKGAHQKMKKLIEVITTPTESIFYALQNLPNVNLPWATDNINEELDIDYLFNRSGNKIISSLTDFFVDSETGKIDNLSISTLAKVLYIKYGVKWNKEYATLSLQYNPINNYDMTEHMTNDITTHQFGHTNTRTDNTNETSETEKAGFNSSTYAPVDKVSTKGNAGTVADVETGTNTDTRNYLLTRSGNIGVTTSQQMIESERKLWLWNFFDEIVYPDIDRVLTINMYE